MIPNEELHILTIHFEPLKRGQPLYKGQDDWSQGVLNMEGSTITTIGELDLVNQGSSPQ